MLSVEYQFFLEEYYSDASNLLIMKTHRRLQTTKTCHVVDAINYDANGHRINSEMSCGRCVSNMSRKKFRLELDDTFSEASTGPSSSSAQSLNGSGDSEILSIAFKSSAGEPRKVIAKACLCSGVSPTVANMNAHSARRGDRVTYILKNRQP